jgi:hypothetical protein
MGSNAEHRKRVRELITAYPYIWAWGKYMGSFQPYMVAESEQAEADDAPADVFHRQSLAGSVTVSARERAGWLADEAEGTAVIVRDDAGRMVTGYSLMSSLRRDDIRQKIELFAREMLDGLSESG